MDSLDRICRICMKSSLVLTPLFSNMSLPRKIRVLSSVKVSEGDNLPSKICVQCVVNVNSAYDFRQSLIDSDYILKERLAESLKNCLHKVEKSEELFACEDDFRETIPVIKREIFNCVPDESNFPQDYTHAMCKTESLTSERSLSPLYEDIFAQDHESNTKVDVVPIHTKKHLSSKYAKSDRNVLCHYCGKQVLMSNLCKHISTHTEAPVTCKVCGKTVKNRECLRSHMSLHKPPVRTCEYCGQTFKFRSSHIVHVRKKHTGQIKKYKCNYCEKAFASNNDLRNHIRTHTGEKPYTCEYCKRGFSRSHALKTHIRQHTKEKPYKCAHCSLSFVQNISLKTHIQSKHPDKTCQKNETVDESK